MDNNKKVSVAVDTFMLSENTQSMQEAIGLTNFVATDSASFDSRISNQETFSSSYVGGTIALDTSDPTIPPGVSATLHTQGYTNETPPRYFKKVGDNDIDWEETLVSIDGKFSANIEIADAAGMVLPENVLGRLGDGLVLGDGVSTGGNPISTFGSATLAFNEDFVFDQIYGDIPQVWKWTTDIKVLLIGTSCTEIGDGAFASCEGLTGSLVIPDSVKTLKISAFANTGLTQVTLGNGINTVGDSAFHTCTNLTGSLVFPDSVETIGSSVLRDCVNLNDVTIGRSVTSIGYFGFYGCTNLTNINCYTTFDAFTSEADESSNYCLQNSGVTTIHALPDMGFASGSNQTIANKSGIEVILDLT